MPRPMDTFKPAFAPGDRVVRPLVDTMVPQRSLDPGKHSSPRRAHVPSSSTCLEQDVGEYRYHYRVAWDDGQVATYLHHGIAEQAD